MSCSDTSSTARSPLCSVTALSAFRNPFQLTLVLQTGMCNRESLLCNREFRRLRSADQPGLYFPKISDLWISPDPTCEVLGCPGEGAPVGEAAVG